MPRLIALKCPSCFAPVKDIDASYCKYCGAAIIHDHQQLDPNRKLKMFRNTKKYTEDIDVSLETALKRIDEQPTEKQVENNFIGFHSEDDKDDLIQFIRIETDRWMIDAPIMVNGTYSKKTLQDANLSTLTVKQIVSCFYNNKVWRHLCKLG
jgi:hypothetical protein